MAAGLGVLAAPDGAASTLAAAARDDRSRPVPSLAERALVELRADARASRSVERQLPAPSPTTVAPAVPPPAPTPAPIVGTFPPVEGCTATVPQSPPANGQLDSSELCSIGASHSLRADAAATYLAMDAAFTAEFGVPLAITDSYRDYGTQARLYGQKPGLAARPGTSNHGWGIAVDMFGGVDSYGSAEHAWLTEHGDEYGWVNPGWAQAGGSRPEPWHWEFDAALLG